jgi:gluconate 2-dehydrogenase gamma chain
VFRGELPWTGGAAAPNPQIGPDKAYVFFNSGEAAFVEAAVARMIPTDDLGPGGIEAGVPEFIDRQLAGEFGQGTRWYMQGPWSKGEGTQGYQSRMTPAAMYRAAIPAIDAAVGKAFAGRSFAQLPGEEQDSILSKIESGQLDLGQIEAKSFFEMFLQNVMEGFWSDPIYGGNKNMIGWKLIGFPGARYDHRDFVSRHGEPYPLPPVGLNCIGGGCCKTQALGRHDCEPVRKARVARLYDTAWSADARAAK